MSRTSRKLFSTLLRAHRLSRRERRICRRLAVIYDFTGKSGPETSPSVLFFRPSYWEHFVQDARDGRDGLDPAEVEALSGKIFGEEEPAVAPSPPRASAAVMDELPLEW